MTDENYIVAGTKAWTRTVFDDLISGYDGDFTYVDTPESLKEKIAELKPRYVFFLHWSSIVPPEIVNNFDCVCFHMTDVPFGRGGSPLQNLIIRGIKETKVTALRMVEALDAGPVYVKESLNISDGTADKIYKRASEISAKIIKRMVTEDIVPIEQEGEIVSFKRRRPEESEIPKCDDVSSLYDFIRMLDAETYPKAFIRYKGMRLEFSGAAIKGGALTANVEMIKEE